TAPDIVLDRLRECGWRFYTFIGGGARFMFAWDADLARVNALAQDLREISGLVSTEAAVMLEDA
ncbi:hypothetical protein ACO1K0_14285, partial [Staphylococcus aureus]